MLHPAALPYDLSAPVTADMAPHYSIRVKSYSISCAEKPAYGAASGAMNTAGRAAVPLCAVIGEKDGGQEHFAVLFLDYKLRPIACKTLFSGGEHETPVFPGIVARHALLLGARAL